MIIMSDDLKLCRNQHCECAIGKCTHPGYRDAREAGRNPDGTYWCYGSYDDPMPHWFAEYHRKHLQPAAHEWKPGDYYNGEVKPSYGGLVSDLVARPSPFYSYDATTGAWSARPQLPSSVRADDALYAVSADGSVIPVGAEVGEGSLTGAWDGDVYRAEYSVPFRLVPLDRADVEVWARTCRNVYHPRKGMINVTNQKDPFATEVKLPPDSLKSIADAHTVCTKAGAYLKQARADVINSLNGAIDNVALLPGAVKEALARAEREVRDLRRQVFDTHLRADAATTVASNAQADRARAIDELAAARRGIADEAEKYRKRIEELETALKTNAVERVALYAPVNESTGEVLKGASITVRDAADQRWRTIENLRNEVAQLRWRLDGKEWFGYDGDGRMIGTKYLTATEALNERASVITRLKNRNENQRVTIENQMKTIDTRDATIAAVSKQVHDLAKELNEVKLERNALRSQVQDLEAEKEFDGDWTRDDEVANLSARIAQLEKKAAKYDWFLRHAKVFIAVEEVGSQQRQGQLDASIELAMRKTPV